MRIETAIPISLAFVKEALGIKADPTDRKRFASAICTDSREIYGGEIFIGLRGEKYDGSVFINKIKNSALCSIGSLGSDADITLADTVSSLLHIAYAYKKLLPIKKTIAITGSVGKTTTKNLTAKLMSFKYRVHSTYKNLNNEIGVPFTILSAPADTEMLILEAGMNHIGELERISLSAEPDISVITKIGTAHIGNLGSREKIADAKLEILSGMKRKFALIPYGEELLSKKIECFKTISTCDNDATYKLLRTAEEEFVFKSHGSEFKIKASGIKSAGFHVSECLAFALASYSELGASVTELTDAIGNIDFNSLSNRVVVNGLQIINDSYNSSPEATEEALKALSLEKGKKSALIGDMLELGDFSRELHFKIGLTASQCGLDKLYLLGAFAKDVYNGAVCGGFDKNRIFVNEDAESPEITAEQIRNHSSSDVILFKASRKIKLERIINILKKAEK